MSTDMVIPDEVEPTIGWRAWTYTAQGLVSPQQGTAWPPREAVTAECQAVCLMIPMPTEPTAASHPAPDMMCNCGIHASVLAEHAIGYTVGMQIIGTVKLWGRVVDCEWGWRGQYAYPAELWLIAPSERADVVRPIADQISVDYGVPCSVSPLADILARANEILPPDPEKAKAYARYLTSPQWATMWSSTMTWGRSIEPSWWKRHACRILYVASAVNLGCALYNLWVTR